MNHHCEAVLYEMLAQACERQTEELRQIHRIARVFFDRHYWRNPDWDGELTLATFYWRRDYFWNAFGVRDRVSAAPITLNFSCLPTSSSAH